MQKPHAEKGLSCPLHKKDMSLVCHKCAWWKHVRGKHPQSGEEIDRWDCAVPWLVLLTIENSMQQRSTAAAVESFRNETVNSNRQAMAALLGGVVARPMIEGRNG